MPRTTASRLGLAILVGAPTAVALVRGGVDSATVAITAAAMLAATALLLPRASPPPLGFAGLALVCLVSVLQLVPVPPFLHHLSPLARGVFERSLGPVGLYPTWRPFSLDLGGTAMGLVHALACTLAFAASATLARSRRRKRALVAAIAASAVTVAAVALGGALLGLSPLVEPHVPFVNPNHQAALLSLGGLACLGLAMDQRGQARVAWLVAFIVVASALLLSLSRGGMAGLAVGLVVLGALQLRQHGGGRRVAIGAAAAGLAALAAAYLALPALSRELGTVDRALGKAELWGPVVRLIGGAPLTGIGRGAFATVFPSVKEDEAPVTYTHVENEWLQAPVDLGVPGGLLLLGSVMGTWAVALRRAHLRRLDTALLAGLAAVGTHELFDFSLEALGVALPFFMALGLVARPSARLRWSPRTARAIAPAAALVAFVALGVAASASRATAGLAAAPTDLERARAAAASALAFAPADHLPHLAVGAAAAGERRWSEAIPSLLMALERDPTNATTHRLLGRCLASTGRRTLARFEYRLALRNGDPSALDEAAAIFPALEDLLAIVPDTPDDLLRAAARLATGHATLAEPLLRRAWEDHRDPRALPPLAHALIVRGAHEEGLAVAQTLAHAGTAPVEAALLEARALYGLGSREESRRALERGAQLSPGDWRFLVGIAEAHIAARQFSRARTFANEIVPRSSREAAAKYLLLARILSAQDRLGEAIVQATSAAAASPLDPDILDQLSGMQERAGRLADAVASLERAASVAQAPRPEFTARLSRLRAALAAAPADVPVPPQRRPPVPEAP